MKTFQCGTISSVRIVRDAATGIGKGFGYVNFASEDSVEIALTLNGSELDGRKIRVSRLIHATVKIIGLEVILIAISDVCGRRNPWWGWQSRIKVGQRARTRGGPLKPKTRR